MCTAVVRTIKLVIKRSLTLSQCALAGSVYTGMPLVDPVYTGILLGDPANAAGYTGTPLEKRSWNCPTLECHWRNSDHWSLLWNTIGGTVTAHKYTWDLSSKWIGLCKFSFNLEFTALQWIWVLLFKRVSISTSLCICLGYEHHYTFCVYGLQFKWNQLNSTNSRHTSCIHKGLYAEKWPDLVTSKPDSVSTLGRLHWNHTGWCYHCNTVWHFCSNRSLYKLDKVHKQALRVVLNDYTSSYSDLLTKMARPTLYVIRLKAIATEAYKSYANENPAYINAMLNPSIAPFNLRGGSRAEQPTVNTTSCGLNTFSYQAAKLWIIYHILSKKRLP